MTVFLKLRMKPWGEFTIKDYEKLRLKYDGSVFTLSCTVSGSSVDLCRSRAASFLTKIKDSMVQCCDDGWRYAEWVCMLDSAIACLQGKGSFYTDEICDDCYNAIQVAVGDYEPEFKLPETEGTGEFSQWWRRAVSRFQQEGYPPQVQIDLNDGNWFVVYPRTVADCIVGTAIGSFKDDSFDVHRADEHTFVYSCLSFDDMNRIVAGHGGMNTDTWNIVTVF